MQERLSYIKKQLPYLEWKIEKNIICANSGILRFCVGYFGRQTEVSIYDFTISRAIFILSNQKLEDAVSILKLHLEKLKKSLEVVA